LLTRKISCCDLDFEYFGLFSIAVVVLKRLFETLVSIDIVSIGTALNSAKSIEIEYRNEPYKSSYIVGSFDIV
jgi:hypothetical protein